MDRQGLLPDEAETVPDSDAGDREVGLTGFTMEELFSDQLSEMIEARLPVRPEGWFDAYQAHEALVRKGLCPPQVDTIRAKLMEKTRSGVYESMLCTDPVRKREVRVWRLKKKE